MLMARHPTNFYHCCTTIAPLLRCRRYRQVGLDLEEKGHTRFRFPNDTWAKRQH